MWGAEGECPSWVGTKWSILLSGWWAPVVTINHAAPDKSPLPLGTAEQEECPHVLLLSPSCWVTLTQQCDVFGQGMCLQLDPCTPFPRCSLLEASTAVLVFSFPYWNFLKNLCWGLAGRKWTESKESWSPVSCAVSQGQGESLAGAWLVAGVMGLGASIRERLSGWWEHMTNSQESSTKVVDILKCQQREGISIINRILTFKITIPATVLSRRSKHHHFNIKRQKAYSDFFFFYPFFFFSSEKHPLLCAGFFPFFFPPKYFDIQTVG